MSAEHLAEVPALSSGLRTGAVGTVTFELAGTGRVTAEGEAGLPHRRDRAACSWLVWAGGELAVPEDLREARWPGK